jgi:3-oxoacyl-[acyl-carrier-protein] synthase II
MEHGIIPPTINLDNPDIEAGCDLDYVPNVAYHYPTGERPNAIISDNLGFGELFIF